MATRYILLNKMTI